MEMTNMQADMILGQLNTIYGSLTKSAEPAPCTLTFGLAKTIRKCQTELFCFSPANSSCTHQESVC